MTARTSSLPRRRSVASPRPPAAPSRRRPRHLRRLSAPLLLVLLQTVPLLLLLCPTSRPPPIASAFSLRPATTTATAAAAASGRTASLSPRKHAALAAAAAESSDNDVGKDGGDEKGDDTDEHKQLNIAFVTGNAMKAREIELILREHGATCGPTPDDPSMVNLRMLNVDLPEIQEINTEAIAKNKAIQGAQLAGGPCVVEDTSLQFTALGGMPGPFIKWFQQTLRSEGLYKILIGYEDKSATAVCTLAFCPYPHADPVVFTGITRGEIVAPVEGRGFGWDSIFVPDEWDDGEPFSCMSTEKKCSMSHRGKAVRKWADWLGANREELWERQGGRPAVGHKGLDFKSDFAEE